ncbi:DUF4126 domain-containing protein [Spongiivirga sp. MCCC 1A20706]|uniref:DUF4126 domain-containing protein n=1 Tax=Spongiivirga sp. MCCC 1A20706 TaxID=3160963 RepID=UPI003977416E
MDTVLSIFLGVGLAASVGFRVFVPLFALSLAAYLGHIPLNESWMWVGSLTALIVLGVATVVEIFAYYIPWVDNLLDTIAVPLAAVAGTAVMVATMADLDPVVTWSLAIIAGGGTATVIASTSAATRLASTATTGGLGNSGVSTVETATAGILSITSVFVPIVAFVLTVVIILIVRFFYKKVRGRTT